MKNRSSLVLALSVVFVALATAEATAAPQRGFRSIRRSGSAQQYNQTQKYNQSQNYNSNQQYNKVQQYNNVQQYNTPSSAQKYNSQPSNSQSGMRTNAVWYQALTDDREHNFGVVARASKQERIFEFDNTTDGDLYLTGVRTSCGCTKPKILTQHVRPGEKAKISARFDTVNFYGSRGATVTVSLKKAGRTTQYGELQFTVKGNIRRDVVLNPGEITFDGVIVSEGANRTARMLYAGNPQWKIVEIKSTNQNVVAEAKEVERNPATGRVAYDLVVSLNDQQDTGTFSEFLTIVTNDAKTTGMPVAVKGSVKPRIEVSAIQLGPVNQDQRIKKKLILQSATPFSVRQVKTNDARIKFEPSQGEKTLHILTYTLDTSIVGQIDEELTILTSDPNQPEATVPFSAQIVPATIAGRSK